ncbi:MAG: GDSL-type esterase/lipase family protein [Colwellia sp.]
MFKKIFLISTVIASILLSAWSVQAEPNIADKPLFRDTVYDGAADPVVIWNKAEKKWFMFYTNRRANTIKGNSIKGNPKDVSWVHGTPIGIAESTDSGASWTYRGEANINYGGKNITYWAPDVVYHNNAYHMFLTIVPGVFKDWQHPRTIVHLTSKNLIDWQFDSELNLVNNKVIDASVIQLPDGTWRLWYNNEKDGKSIYYADSPDLFHWTDKGKITSDTGERGEGQKIFFWKNKYFMILDEWQGLGVYSSPDLVNWTRQPDRILANPGTGKQDKVKGQHADVVVNNGRAYIFYFTHSGQAPLYSDYDGSKDEKISPYEHARSLIQVAELNYNDGKITCDRNKPVAINLIPPNSTINFDFADTDVNKQNPQQKYSFDFDSAKHAIFAGNALTASSSVYFSTELDEGNYKIELTLGSDIKDSVTTVKAEARRLMINQLKIPKGQSVTKTIMVNVRTPRIDENSQIKLNKRELNHINWDNKLTLEFAKNSAVRAIKITPVENVTTIFLAGDSTVTDQNLSPWASWGQLITQYFDDNIVIANYAESGESLHSFKASNRLEKIKSKIKPGDYLFVEFAHNDEKRRGKDIGPWQSYSQLLAEFVKTARKKGANPVLITPTQRRFFHKNGKLKPTHGDYPEAMRTVSRKLKVPLIDVTQMTTTLYQSWGDKKSRNAFVQYPANTFPNQTKALKDNTHFNYFGANEVALCVLKGINDLKLELVNNIEPKAFNYSPVQPNYIKDWTVPMSTRMDHIKPAGN